MINLLNNIIDWFKFRIQELSCDHEWYIIEYFHGDMKNTGVGYAKCKKCNKVKMMTHRNWK